jgi:predicted HTH domain antitoxin
MRNIVLDDELAALLEREKPLEQATRELLVMGLFQNGKISTGKACELLGIERMAFVGRAAELGAPVYLTTEGEWESDLASLKAWRQELS